MLRKQNAEKIVQEIKLSSVVGAKLSDNRCPKGLIHQKVFLLYWCVFTKRNCLSALKCLRHYYL